MTLTHEVAAFRAADPNVRFAPIAVIQEPAGSLILMASAKRRSPFETEVGAVAFPLEHAFRYLSSGPATLPD